MPAFDALAYVVLIVGGAIALILWSILDYVKAIWAIVRRTDDERRRQSSDRE